MKKPVETSKSDTGQHVEQRREPRRAAEGEIRFSFGQGGGRGHARDVRGMLLDRSASGFRAQHDCAELTSGQVVQFRLTPASKGHARVMWTRIMGDRVETGFLILPEVDSEI
jgi:hypothetical protein